MEDALVLQLKAGDELYVARLNPCFNGRCTRTFIPLSNNSNVAVS